MLNVIRKKPKNQAAIGARGAAGEAGGDQGYGATAKKGDNVGGVQGMVVDQHAQAQQ